MNKLLIVLGTRPEAVKLIPVIKELQKQDMGYEILNTNQHAEILDILLEAEGIITDYKLCICERYANMIEMKAAMLEQTDKILGRNTYAAVIVQGDTLSTLVGAEYGFMQRIPVYHVEAGMRTYNPDNPYPEESFRRMISIMTTLHFCPSEDEKKYLIAEGFSEENIYVVGNTFVDYRKESQVFTGKKEKQILITLHRRENVPYLNKILAQIAELAKEYCEYQWLFPVHPNPILMQIVNQYLGGIVNVNLCSPLAADKFYKELLLSEVIISDSGGVQEECILNAKKMLVIREVSERKSDFNFMELVSPIGNIKEKFALLLDRKINEKKSDYYGTGDAAEKIVQIILKEGSVK